MPMLRFAGLTFAVAAFAGPLIRLVTWPPSRFERMTSTGVERFVYDLVFYLWPTQLLCLAEPSKGSSTVVLLSVLGNVLLFGLLGFAVGAGADRRGVVPLTYLAVCGLLVLFALWEGGFGPEHVSWLPLVSAMSLYAIPFWLIARAAARPGIPS